MNTFAGMVISLVIWSGVGVIVAMAAELSIDVIGVFGVIVDTAKKVDKLVVWWELYRNESASYIQLPKWDCSLASFGIFFTLISIFGIDLGATIRFAKLVFLSL